MAGRGMVGRLRRPTIPHSLAFPLPTPHSGVGRGQGWGYFAVEGMADYPVLRQSGKNFCIVLWCNASPLPQSSI